MTPTLIGYKNHRHLLQDERIIVHRSIGSLVDDHIVQGIRCSTTTRYVAVGEAANISETIDHQKYDPEII